MIEHRIPLADGRTLAAAEVGHPDGVPVLYAHGFPGSRLGIELAADQARDKRIRLIGIDRPGWGESDPLHGRRLVDWPFDLVQAADFLGCARFNLLGVSGGAPFTLACVAALGDRVGRAALVCGLGPVSAMRDDDGMMRHNRAGLRLAKHHRGLVRPLTALVGPVLKLFFEPAIAHLERNAGPADRQALADPKVRAIFGREFREAFRRGGAGAAADGLIYGADWGFDLSAVRCPVFLWHGESDRVVPVGMAHWVAERVPGIRAVYVPGEGHFSIVIRRLPEVLEVLRADPAC